MTCRGDDKSGCAWMCQIFVIQSKEGQKLYKEYPIVLVQFFYQDMIVYATGDVSTQFLYLQSTKLPNIQEFTIILRVVFAPQDSQYSLTYFVVLKLDILS